MTVAAGLVAGSVAGPIARLGAELSGGPDARLAAESVNLPAVATPRAGDIAGDIAVDVACAKKRARILTGFL